MTDKQPKTDNKADPSLESEARRKALKKLGKGALYVPPTMVTLLITEKQAAASLGGPPPPP